MTKAKQKIGTGSLNIISGIDDLGDDLMQNILSRLPALPFASAACVSRSWNTLCNQLLSSPKLSSAISFNSSLENAINEVVDKVLSEPIRPHFALASVGPCFSLQAAYELMCVKLGSRVPVIINQSEGVIGRDVRTGQYLEVQWEVTQEEENDGAISPENPVNGGIILTVGFLPGLKAHIIPLMSSHKGHRRYRSLLVDEFVMDIREFASAVSNSTSPAGIIMFAKFLQHPHNSFAICTLSHLELNHVLGPENKHQTCSPNYCCFSEYAFPRDTCLVGDGGSNFLYRIEGRDNVTSSPICSCAAVALIFGRDKNKPLGIGETQFHVMLSTGLSPVGFTYKAVSVKCNKGTTWLTASRETVRENLDGQAILEDIYDQLGDRIHYPAFYVGVRKKRRGDEEYLYLNSVGIQTGEPFRFFVSDSNAALSSCNKVSQNLRQLKLYCESRNTSEKREVFGGIIFSCCGRGDSFFGQQGIDSSPFIKNFPGVTFGGTYCAGEIGREYMSLYDQGNEQGAFVHCSEHVYSAVYLVMSYCAPPSS